VTALHNFLLAAALMAALVGAVFAAGTVYYLAGYLGAADAAAAAGALVAVAEGLRYSFAAFAVAAALVMPARRAMPPALLRLLAAPAVITGLLLLALTVWRAAAA